MPAALGATAPINVWGCRPTRQCGAPDRFVPEDAAAPPKRVASPTKPRATGRTTAGKRAARAKPLRDNDVDALRKAATAADVAKRDQQIVQYQTQNALQAQAALLAEKAHCKALAEVKARAVVDASRAETLHAQQLKEARVAHDASLIRCASAITRANERHTHALQAATDNASNWERLANELTKTNRESDCELLRLRDNAEMARRQQVCAESSEPNYQCAVSEIMSLVGMRQPLPHVALRMVRGQIENGSFIDKNGPDVKILGAFPGPTGTVCNFCTIVSGTTGKVWRAVGQPI